MKNLFHAAVIKSIERWADVPVDFLVLCMDDNERDFDS